MRKRKRNNMRNNILKAVTVAMSIVWVIAALSIDFATARTIVLLAVSSTWLTLFGTANGYMKW